MAEVEGAVPAAGTEAAPPEFVEGAEGGEEAAAPAPAVTSAYTLEEISKMTEFFNKRRKNHEGFFWNAEGNLETREGATVGARRRPEPAGVITLKSYVPLDPTERAQLEQDRLDSLAEIESRIEIIQGELAAAWGEYRASGSISGVLSANQKMAELDAERNRMRSEERGISFYSGMSIKDLVLSNPQEKRKLPFLVYRAFYYPFKLEREEGKYVASEEAQREEEEAAAATVGAAPLTEAQVRMKDGRIGRIFYGTESENGFLSPELRVEIVLEETRYSSPYQAYEAERAKELGQEALRKEILKSQPTGRAIRILYQRAKVTAQPADPAALWMKVLTAVYQQHAELKGKLLATGTDTLIYADPREGPSGIALGESDSGALDPTRWKGANAVGKALETIRTQMREDTLAEAPKGGARESAKTEEDFAKDKVGAIIAARRAALGGGFRKKAF
jgi:predicted NAD-dependent protein-ADP-ribosyltransferase YbiA (DUF1768 family)